MTTTSPSDVPNTQTRLSQDAETQTDLNPDIEAILSEELEQFTLINVSASSTEDEEGLLNGMLAEAYNFC